MERNGPDPDTTNTHTFTTERLEIGVPESRDVDEIFQLIGGNDRRDVAATLVWDGPDSLGDVAKWVELAGRESFRPFGFHWTLRDRTGEVTGTPGCAVGAIGTRPRGQPGRGDVGYWLGKPYWGQGLMGEALAALLEHGFTDLSYYKMEADVFANNTRGRRLVESAGMKEEGTTRRAYLKSGEYVDAVQYGILYEEWVL